MVLTPHFFIASFIHDSLCMFAIARFMSVFFEKRRTKTLVMVFSYSLYLALATIQTLLFFYSTVFSIIPTFVMPFIISLNYESSVPKRVIAAASIFTVLIIIDQTAISYLYLFPDYLHDMIYFWGALTVGVLSNVAAHLFRRFKNIRKRDIPMPLFWVSAFVILGSILIQEVISDKDSLIIVPMSYMFLMLGVIFLVFYIYDTLSSAYDDKLKAVLHAQESVYYLSQCQYMQESLEKMKSFRHDMKMHLTTLKDFTADDKGAADYLSRLLGNMEESEIYCDTGNIAVDSLINFKLRNAKEDHITAEVKISLPSVLNIEVADIVTIAGNLLDNGLEAVAKVKEKVIRLTIQFSDENLAIQIEHTFDGTNMEDNPKRKKLLLNIKETAEKYKGCLDITYTDTIFSAGLFLCSDNKRMRV